MTLKIVSNDSTQEVHSVRIDDGVITIIAVSNGSKVTISEMDELFPDFENIVKSAAETKELLSNLQSANDGFVWAHVSGKL